MSEVKWIKITTGMFEDEKIDFIDSLPEADAILVIWVRLLTLAGKCNAGGYILLTENIPYTEEMLAHKFRRPLNVVKLAFETFRKLEMIQTSNNGIYINNWEKHQNIEGLQKIREQTKKRVQRHREKKLLECNVTVTDDVTPSNAIDIDIDIDIDKEINNYKSIFDYYLTLDLKKHRSYTKDMTNAIKKAMSNNNYTIDYCKTLLDRHSEVVKMTKNLEYPVRARGLAEFFGQKAYNATHLICSEYEEGGKYYNFNITKIQNSNKKVKNVSGEKRDLSYLVE